MCFGEVVPAIDFLVFFEFGHRVLAGLVSLGFLGLTIAALRRPELRGRLWPLSLFSAVALTAQIVLGGLTVLELLAEWTVTSHLVCGNLVAVSFLLQALFLGDEATPVRRAPISAAARGLAVLTALVVPAQLALGGLVSSSHAGLACGTWPTCDGANWFPTFSGLVGLQVTHRLVAYTLAAVIGLVALATVRHPQARNPALALVALVLFQITVGVANVYGALPVEVTLMHSAGAASIALATTWLNYVVWRAPLAVAAPSASGHLEGVR